MIADDYDDLHQKINKKFIRNVIKPIQQIERQATEPLPYQIPSASELFGAQRGGSLPVPRPQRTETDWVPFEPHSYREDEGYVEESFETSPAPLPSRPRRRVLSATPRTSPILVAPPTPTPTSIPTPEPTPMNCVTICAHVQSCPVCSQLYRPYIGVYLAVIVILIIVILFLLKKIFQF